MGFFIKKSLTKTRTRDIMRVSENRNPHFGVVMKHHDVIQAETMLAMYGARFDALDPETMTPRLRGEVGRHRWEAFHEHLVLMMQVIGFRAVPAGDNHGTLVQASEVMAATVLCHRSALANEAPRLAACVRETRLKPAYLAVKKQMAIAIANKKTASAAHRGYDRFWDWSYEPRMTLRRAEEVLAEIEAI
jgi:hypothetical protein